MFGLVLSVIKSRRYDDLKKPVKKILGKKENLRFPFHRGAQ
jgi:nitrogen fixation-related uncharacterized protein